MDRRPLSRLSRLARLVIVALCPLGLVVGACSRPATPAATSTPRAEAPRAPDAGFLNQWRSGQDARELARTWYLTPQGSHLIDFDVFMSVPAASDPALLFSDRANLESYGFLYSDDYQSGIARQGESTYSGGLPLGVVKDARGEGYTPLAKHAFCLDALPRRVRLGVGKAAPGGSADSAGSRSGHGEGSASSDGAPSTSERRRER